MSEALPFPALHASHGGAWVRSGEETRAIGKGEAIGLAADTPVLLLNAPLVASRLGYPELSGLDLLELYAFVHPARFVVPTAKGLAHALGLDEPGDEAAVPALLHLAAQALLAGCRDPAWPEREGAWSALQALARLRWPWAGPLAAAVARPDKAERWLFARLPEWEEAPPRPQPAQVAVDGDTVDRRLAAMLGPDAEQRPGQRDYARAVAAVFAPRPRERTPHLLLAQAGTGVGKTLGYLAPAAAWSEQAGGTVWVSTYTKALQRQLLRESGRAFAEGPAGHQPRVPDGPADDRPRVPEGPAGDRPRVPEGPAGDRPRVVVRKGRENYLCLLNLEDALQGGFAGRPAIMAQLVARWAAYTRDGDMVGGDLPGWLGTLFRQRGIAALSDRRGECVYAGCPHYRKCFIERTARASAQADLVIANHALVMVNAARSSAVRGREQVASRILFDEGHHVFDAADATFAAALTGRETIELRRWIVGPECRARGRRRGLAARLADLAGYDEDGARAIAEVTAAAGELPADGWLARVVEGARLGAVEVLFAAVRQLVHARDESGGVDAGYGLETEAAQLDGAFVETAGQTQAALDAIRRPLLRLGARIEALLADPPDWLDATARGRLDGVRSALDWRCDLLAAWIALLGRLGGPADPDFVDWLAVDRSEGRELDIGLHRRWLDPTRPFAQAVLAPAHGVLLTSATLCDRGHDAPDWAGAVARSGAAHLDLQPLTIAAPSPFDYAAQAEVLIVTDVPRGDIAQLAAAYGRLIEAAGGGVLGLFTAVRRLRTVYGRIADRLARSGLPLYAQHVDPIDTGTLVDIFRDDPRASLLGTDALRDGVDVPGESLRLVVMEQVPWAKPSILHRARRAAAVAGGISGSAFDDRVVRARLAQAFGRLIRSSDDRGRFVMLSAAFPSRLHSAFPAGTPVRRCTLEEALLCLGSGVWGPQTMVEERSAP